MTPFKRSQARHVEQPHPILEGLRLAVPTQIKGIDLYRCAAGLELPAGRAQVATLKPRYATRVGTWLLSGKLGSA